MWNDYPMVAMKVIDASTVNLCIGPYYLFLAVVSLIGGSMWTKVL